MHRKLYPSSFVFFVAFVGTASLSVAFAATPPTGHGTSLHRPTLEKVFDRINSDVLKNGRAYETLSDASGRIGHRLTGSNNGAKAEQYAYDLLRSYGFKEVRYEPFEVESWMRDTVTLSVVPNKSDNFRDLKVVSLAHSPVEAHIRGEIIDVGNGLEADFAILKERIKGKVALINIGLSGAKGARNLHRSEKTALAIQYGAIGVIMVNLVPGNVLLTGTASVTGRLIPIPAVCISYESGVELRQWMVEENKDHIHALIDMTNTSRKIKARNVIATLPGSELPNEKIVIGGHLDSWDLATGAIDNGIGSFSVLDIARSFRKLKLKPKRTIEFVMFMGEEQGLLGSRAMAEELKRRGQLDNVRYVMNLDMTNDPTGINAFGRDDMVSFFKTIGESIQQVVPAFQNQMTNQAGLHSDHQPFMIEGVPVVGMNGHLSKEVLDCYHADCDRINLANREQMQNTVRYSAMVLYALADADAIPTRRLDDRKTRDYLIAQGLRTPLQIANEWRWKE